MDKNRTRRLVCEHSADQPSPENAIDGAAEFLAADDRIELQQPRQDPARLVEQRGCLVEKWRSGID